MSCRISRDPSTKKVLEVRAANGKSSLLYKSLLKAIPDNYTPDTYIQGLINNGKLKKLSDELATYREWALGLYNKAFTSAVTDRFSTLRKDTNDEPTLESYLSVFPDTFGGTTKNETYYQRLSSKGDTSTNSNYTVDSDIRKKYFSNGNVTTVSEVLQKIGNSTHLLHKLANHLIPYAQNLTTPVLLKSTDRIDIDGFGAVGVYMDNRIEIAEFGKFSKGSVETTLLHEILHALTTEYLHNSSGKLKKDFEQLYNQSIKQFGKYNPDTNENYFNYDIDEFLVALFTNAAFIKKLQNTSAVDNIRYQNLFEEIMQYILSLFNINSSDTLYEQAFAVATQIIYEANTTSDLWDGFNSVNAPQSIEDYQSFNCQL